MTSNRTRKHSKTINFTRIRKTLMKISKKQLSSFILYDINLNIHWVKQNV